MLKEEAAHSFLVPSIKSASAMEGLNKFEHQRPPWQYTIQQIIFE